jgi:hypothetical protein
MNAKMIEQIGEHEYRVPKSYLPVYYYDAFNALHRYENLLRVFIYTVLKSARAGDWIHAPVRSSASGQLLTISSISKRRISEMEDYSHISTLPNVPLLYLTVDDLYSMMTHPANIDLFRRQLKPSLDKVLGPKLNELREIRNHLTHFRKILSKDLSRLLLNLEDILGPILGYLQELTADYTKIELPGPERFQAIATSMLTKERRFSSVGFNKSTKNNWIKLNILFQDIDLCQYKNDIYGLEIDEDSLKDRIAPLYPHLIYFENRWETEEVTDEEDGTPLIFEVKGLDIVFHYDRFNEFYETILVFIDDLMDEFESEYLEHIEYCSKNKDPHQSSHKLSRVLNKGGFNDDFVEDPDFERELKDATEKREATEFSKKHGFKTRIDIPEDWTYPMGRKWSLLEGDMPWLT